jgi:DNA-directed RNA polymerase specialized sigma24 family protein
MAKIMESRNRYDGVDPRAVQFVRYHARRLAARRAVRGWEVEDYEQDLIADLLARLPRFDPSRASRATFGDRVIRHRVSTLIAAGARVRRIEQETVEPSVAETDGDAQVPSLEAQCSICLDLDRFICGLPDRLRCCCHWLMADNRRAAAAVMGLHRSTLYQSARDLQQRAIEAGLDAYIGQAGPTLLTSAR